MTSKRGAALVEFALMALALYILIFGGIELGRMIFIAQVLQDAARIAARELSVTPLPAGYTFDCPNPDPMSATCTTPNSYVLNDTTVLANIWNPNLLVIDTSPGCYDTDDKLSTYWNSLPLVNRALRPAFISETINPGQAGERRFLRYAGGLIASATPTQNCPATYQDWLMTHSPTSNPSDHTVAIYKVMADGTVDPNPVPVLAEVRSNPDPNTGPFSFSSTGPQQGIAAVAVNYPFQSAALSGFRSGGFDANGAPNPNMGNVIVSDDAPVQTNIGTYAGTNGLGNQVALPFTGSTGMVRPYRNMLLGQAIFRREVTD